MPRRYTEDDAEYQELPSAPRQARFPARRKVIKQKSALPRLTKSQSTLTQVGWAGLPSSGSRVMEDDDDYAKPRPKRQRRSLKLGKTESQPTYTQAVHSAPARRARRPRLDEDGFEIWQDLEEAVDTPMQAVARNKLQHVTQSEVGEGDDENDAGTGVSLEIPESELSDDSTMVHSSRVRDDKGTDRRFATPRRGHSKEIPSSQSPASVKLSNQRSIRSINSLRSPLRERSGNVPSPTKSALKVASSVLSKGGLLTAAEGNDSDLSAIDASESASAPKTGVTTPRAVRTLKRINTVPETQFEDLDADLEKVETEIETHILPLSERRPRRTFQRTNTIQDSQHEDSDLELDWPEPTQYVEDHAADDDVDYDDQAGTYDEFQQDNTYDPAYSALDRDAARFADEIQTQVVKLEPHVSNSVDSEDEEILEDETLVPLGMNDDEPESSASEQLSTELMQAAEAVPSSQPSERYKEAVLDPRNFSGLALPPRTATQNGMEEAAPQERDEERVPSSPPPQQPLGLLQYAEPRVPSSPPPLHPSQVSTVMPTQMSPRRPISREGNESLLRSIKREKETRTQILPLVFSPQVRISPQKTLRSWPETYASSSPLPLPPWSSPDRARFGGAGTQGMGSLADFSLPPPPPLSSSSGQEE